MKPSLSHFALTVFPETWWTLRHLDAETINKPWLPPAGLIGPDAPWITLHTAAHIGGRPGPAMERAALGQLARIAGRAGWTVAPAEGAVLTFCKASRSIAMLRDAEGSFEGVGKPMQFGKIVGFARILSVQAPGQGHAWRLDRAQGWIVEIRVLPDPIERAGGQRLWTMDGDTFAAVQAQF